MEAVFLNLLNMSIAASWLVLAVVLLRLLLKKAPKALLCLLWGLVGVRLVFPIPFESILSLIPSAQTVPPDIMYSAAPTIDSGVPIVNSTVNPIISESWAPQVGQSINPMQIITSVASWVWIVGIVGMILYTVISYLRLRSRVREAVPMEDNILLCDRIPSPFILGLFRPRIYLPSSMSKADMQYVIAHEKAHLKRRDHFWKPLGFAILTVYWFNPFMWLAYILLCRDIELACDEKVIKNMGEEIKKPYSNALINCSVPRKMIAACPLAFGEVSVKGRIKSVLNYKKPAFWIVIVAIIAGIVVSVCFLTNPKSSPDEIIQLKSGSELDGVSVEIVDSDFSSVDSFIEIKWNNETEKDVMFGEEFYIYKDSKDCRTGEYFWNDIAYLLPAGGSNTKKYSLSDMTMTETGEYRFETTCSIDGATPYKEYKVWVEFELSPSAKLIYAYVFTPVELIYADTSFSYIQKAENAPEYKIASNMHLQQQPKNKSKFTDLGQMTEISLNKDNFDSRFYPIDSKLSEKLSRLKKENKKAWELYVDDEYLYLLMEQKDGIFYLGGGYYNHDIMPKRNEDGSYIRWLYRLEKRKSAQKDNKKVNTDTSMFAYSVYDNEITINKCDRTASGDIIIPPTIDGYPVTMLFPQSFKNCKNIESVTIPNTVSYIDMGSFENCKKLKKINLPPNNVVIGDDAFKNTAYYNDPDNWEDGVLYIGNHLIKANEDVPENYAIKDGTVTIANEAFRNLKHLKSIVIPDSEISIPNNAFSECDNLEKIDFLGTKARISHYAITGTELYNNPDNWEDGVLYHDNYLIKANENVSEDYKVKDGTTTIAQAAFENCITIKSITLPDSVEHIESSAFLWCENLESINIPKNTKLKEPTFINCRNLTDIVVDSENKYYCVEDGVLYSKDKKTLLHYPSGDKRETFNVPDGVERISSHAFNSSKYLKKVVLPDSVKKLGDGVFGHCEKLREVVLPDNLNTLPYSTFESCTSLKTFTVPKNITKIQNQAFVFCSSLEEIILPKGLTEISFQSFGGCESLKNIEIPDSVTLIDSYAFEDCDSLEEVTIPGNVKEIRSDAFVYNNKLISVVLEEGVEVIDSYAFGLCNGLEEVTIPDSVKKIDKEAFRSSNNIKIVRFSSKAQKKKFAKRFNDDVKLVVNG